MEYLMMNIARAFSVSVLTGFVGGGIKREVLADKSDSLFPSSVVVLLGRSCRPWKLYKTRSRSSCSRIADDDTA